MIIAEKNAEAYFRYHVHYSFRLPQWKMITVLTQSSGWTIGAIIIEVWANQTNLRADEI